MFADLASESCMTKLEFTASLWFFMLRAAMRDADEENSPEALELCTLQVAVHQK